IVLRIIWLGSQNSATGEVKSHLQTRSLDFHHRLPLLIVLRNERAYRLRLRITTWNRGMQASARDHDSLNAKTATPLSKTVLNAAIQRRNEGAIEQRRRSHGQRWPFLRRRSQRRVVFWPFKREQGSKQKQIRYHDPFVHNATSFIGEIIARDIL